MPEMPEVVTVTKALQSKIKNKTIKDVQVYREKMLKNASIAEFSAFLKNEKILNIKNLGKHIIFELSNEKYLLSHLRMTGKYFTHKYLRNLTKHDYLVFIFDDDSALYYNDARQFGTFYIKTQDDLFVGKPLENLAKEPNKTSLDEFYQKLQKRKIPIKNALLDQSIILGIGNIYANEILFASQINPFKKANELSLTEVQTILKNSQMILDRAIELGGSSIQSYSSVDGIKGQYQNELKVHMRENQECQICHNKIERVEIGQRSTYFCPVCQK
ncbi:DNA-formamidopyrimidine glycosylase [Mycoplasmopsis gallinarum]|uniref:DNA-formamidopyrimidine glycosylase n=1 Tax=Mycoplasmopsis gallinarum TaxID=29557 RepID=UPI0004884D29|nr:DNA-formamidopyrimidine glycosylase [Mycoplasmopsis gallinarum]